MPLAIVRGGGDLATGVIYRLWRIGFAVVVLETYRPVAIRRMASVAQAVFDGAHVVEGMSARFCASISDLPDNGDIGVLADPEGNFIVRLKPDLLVDAIMAKKNCGTRRDMAPRVVAIGPGFRAPGDVCAVVETLRGHDLGRVITNGTAAANTGIPGKIGGETVARLLRSPSEGLFDPAVSIGDRVHVGQVVGTVAGRPVHAGTEGIVRGLVHPTVPVSPHMKIGDVDPRADRESCFSISDKALAVGGGVLEAALAVRP